jgi:hypothetical protein
MRGRVLCGGSLSLVPEAGRGYAARLTPGNNCEEQLFRIDPRAQPPMLLLQTDNHPQDSNMEELICATRRGPPRLSRLAVGGNIGGLTGTKVEIGTGGYCGNFDDGVERAPSVDLAPDVKHWVRLKFPELRCELTFNFTPVAGAAYFVQQDETYYFREPGQIKCEAHLLRIDAADTISPEPIEGEPNRLCFLSH